MATDKGQNENHDEDPDNGNEPAFEGDLSFAADSHPEAPTPPRDDDGDLTDNGQVWTPSPRVEADPRPEDDAESDEESEMDVQKTWVPSETPTVFNEDADQEPPPQPESVEDTWVPEGQETDAPAATADDANRTWVPTDTPTHNGLDDPAEELDETAKTWVPTPAAENDDPNKTWVPSSTPTASGIDGPSSSELDADKTWVPQDTPTHHDFGVDKESESGNDAPGSGTVVMGDRASGAAANDLPTMAGSPGGDPDKTQIFSRTMAMRGMSAEEYNEWQKDVAESDMHDTVSVPAPVNTSDSADGRRTQIWSKQSGGGLDASLTIRSRPVTGDKDFESVIKGDQPDYQIVEKLAEGGMGAVYIAKQTSLNRELAIKTLKPLRKHEKRSYTNQGRMSQVMKQRREMFLSEALVTANLVHPHIIPIHDLCQTVDGSPFYSMKRVIGTPWNEVITEMGLEENLDVLHKVCDAVAYAHHNGVVNRDLKPENIMLGEFGEVLVLDWGLAVPCSTIDNKNFTSASASFGAGTPAYMSPELWAGPADAIGTWSDVYLMGAILFEAITGKAPHKFPEPDSKAGNSGLWKIIDKVVRKNQIRDTNITGELMDIALKAMHIDPTKRHPSVLDFQDAIKGYQKHEESRHLARRAAETLTGVAVAVSASGKKPAAPQKATDVGQTYQDFQTAAALYEESCNAWPENTEARDGLRKARLKYAELAHTKGDYDLGLQVAAQEDGSEFAQLTSKLSRSRNLRNGLKYGTMAAAGIIVLVGAISIFQRIEISKQKDQIVDLYGDKTALEQDLKDGAKKVAEADAKIASADAKVARAEKNLTVATKKVGEAAQDLKNAKAEVMMVQAETREAEAVAVKAREDAATAESNATIAMNEAMAAERKAQIATREAMAAQQAAGIAQKKIATAEVEVARLEVAKVRAGVDLKSSAIANLIRNSDYPAALREVQLLLKAPEENDKLSKLPKSERDERVRELKVSEALLLKRTKSTEAPIQTQVISRSGQTVVWGDSTGKLSVWKVDEVSSELADDPTTTLALRGNISTVRISDDEDLIVAAVKNVLHLWSPADNQHLVIDEHGADITTVVLADRFFLAADAGGAIRAWDIATRKELWSIRSSAGIRDLALLPESRVFLYAGSRGGESADVLAYELPPESDPTARPFRLGQLRFPRDRNDPPKRIAVSPDEQTLLISNSRNGALLVLPRRSEKEFKGRDRFPFAHAADLAQQKATGWLVIKHQRPINDITFSVDGQRVATASDDHSIGVWNASVAGTLLLSERLEGHGAKVNAAGFLDRSGRTVLSASADRFCRFWDVDNYDKNRQMILDRSEKLLPPALSVSAVRIDRIQTSSAPRYILTGDKKSTPPPAAKLPAYTIYNANQERQRGAINSVTLTTDGGQMVTGAADGTAIIWDTQKQRPVTGVSTRSQDNTESGSFEEGHDFNVARLRFLPPHGDVLLTTGFDGNLCLWNADHKKTSAGTQELRIPGLGLVNAVAVSGDGKLIATSAADTETQQGGAAALWKTNDLLQDEQPVPVTVLTGFHRSEVSAVAISPNGQRLATGARDGRVAIWDVESGELIGGGRVHVKNTIVSHLEWLHGDRLLSAGFDGRLLVTEVATDSKKKLTVVSRFDHDKIPIERVAFSADRKQFLTVSVRTDKATKQTKYELQLWRPDTAFCIRHVKPATVRGRKPSRIAAIHWSPDSGRVAVAVDGNLQIINSQTWRIETVLEAPGLGVSDAVFAPTKSEDGADVIATFDGTSAHLWDLNDRSHIADFRPMFAVQATALCENQQYSLLLTGDRAIQIFEAGSDSPHFGQALSKISDPHSGIITSLKFHPTASPPVFASGGADGSAALWQWHPGRNEAERVHDFSEDDAAIVSVSWSPDGSQVLIASVDGRVRTLDSGVQQKLISDFVVPADSDVSLATAEFSADGRFFLVAGQIALSGESRGWIYDVTSHDNPKLHCTIRGHEAGGICCSSFLPDSPYLVTGGKDGAALIWNWRPERRGEEALEAYEAYQLLVDNKALAHDAPINSMAVSTTGTIATGSDDGTAIVWQNPFADE